MSQLDTKISVPLAPATSPAPTDSVKPEPAPFTVPRINDNVEGWGPSHIPEKFRDVPYAPFSKSDKIGRAADWTGQGQFQGRGQKFGQYSSSYAPNPMFSYFHVEDEDSFQLVDNRPVIKPKARRFQGRRGGPHFQHPSGGSQRGRGAGRARQQGQQRRWGTQRRWGMQANEYKKPREPSIEVKDEWRLLQEIDLPSLNKRTADSKEAEDLVECGSVEYYDRIYDRVSTKNERPLERIERTFFKVTTSDDPVIRELASEDAGNVFAIDSILAALMAAPRSVYSWDIVIQRVGSKLFFDKRDNSPIDYITVNETSNDQMDDKDPVNSPQSLAQEATFVNQNYSQQVLQKGRKFNFDRPNPFATAGEDVSSTAYRYRRWSLADNITLVARCELDGVIMDEDKGTDPQFLLIKAVNEMDPKHTGVDWRQKLDSQRGAVLAMELKNNANKLTKWTAQSILSGAHAIQLGYVSRVNTKDPYNHVIMGTQFYRPSELAQQININPRTLWGVLLHIINICMKLPEGKYILMKDPNKSCLKLYEVGSLDDIHEQAEPDEDQKPSEVDEIQSK